MHRCLAIPEILHLICALIGYRNPRGLERRRSLGSLALCCKLFLGPALSVLWKSLDSLRPLLRTLPPSVFKKGSMTFETIRCIEPKDLDKFNFYAPLVQSLSLSSLPDATCLASLHLSCCTPLLPNLRSLDCAHLRGDFFHHILLFLHHKITRLVIRLTPGSYHGIAVSLLPRLPAICPNVHDFAFVGFYDYDNEVHMRITSEVASRWDNVNSLHISVLRETDLRKVAALPYLQRLHIESPHKTLANSAPIPEPAFLALRELCVEVPTMEFGARLMGIVRAGGLNLDKLGIDIQDLSPYDVHQKAGWPLLISAVTQSCMPLALRDLKLNECAFYESEELADEDEEWPRTLTLDALRPLFAFPHLTDLKLRCWGGFLLDDNAMQDLAMAWPLVETLMLETVRADDRPHVATIHALVPLARHCPHLKSLVFDFDAASVVYAPAATRGVRQHSLSDLSVEFSPIKSARVVAAFLSALFPNLRVIGSDDAAEYDGPDAEEEMDAARTRQQKWRQVERLLPMLRFARAQEHDDHPGASAPGEEIADGTISPLDADFYDTDYSDL